VLQEDTYDGVEHVLQVDGDELDEEEDDGARCMSLRSRTGGGGGIKIRVIN
jgi:hypothetical protein